MPPQQGSAESPVSHEGEITQGTWRSKLGAPRGTPPAPGLYIVATPIGHGDDITLRALDILERADLVACEDTRVTSRLLALYGMKAPLIAYHDHNGPKVRPRLIEALKSGAVVALVSDAGTPLISDPGYRLVVEAREAGFETHAIPGASSVMAALAVAGLPTNRFLFEGFLPVKSGARKSSLEALKGLDATLVFFETGPRLAACLSDMVAVLGTREAAVTRELTKKFEEVRRGSLGDLAAHYDRADPAKGEIVLVVGPPGECEADEVDLDGLLISALAEEPLKTAVDRIAGETGLPRRQVYQRALALKDQAP